MRVVSHKSRFVSWALVLAVVALAGQGCRKITLFDVQTVDRPDQVGEVSIAATSLGSFEAYKDALQPSFALTADQAKDDAIETTMFRRMARLHARGTGAQIAASEGNLLDGGDPLPESSLQDPFTATRTAQQLPGDVLTGATPGLNAMMQYQLGTALYQEVQLLEQYLNGLVLDSQYDAYLIRTHIHLMPYGRRMPYDTYVALEFSVFDRVAKPRDVRVLPLLVFDAVESALHGRAIDDINQVAIDLAAVTAQFGLGLQFTDYDELLQAVVGRDYNSLLSVGSPASERLMVRLGAVQQASSGYATPVRNLPITCLVMVEKNDEDAESLQEVMFVDAEVSYRDARTGQRLRSERVDHDSFAEFVSARKKAGSPVPAKDIPQTHEEPQSKTQQSDWSEGFQDPANDTPQEAEQSQSDMQDIEVLDVFQFSDTGTPQAVMKLKDLHRDWLDDVRQSNPGEFASSFTPLKRIIKPWLPRNWPAKPDSLVMFDDGANARVTVTGGKELVASRLAAVMVTRRRGDDDQITVAATAATVSDGGNVLTMTFPSPRRWNLEAPQFIDIDSIAPDQRGLCGPISDFGEPIKYGVVYLLRASLGEPNTKLEFPFGAKTINPANGELAVRFVNFNADESPKLEINGARPTFPDIASNVVEFEGDSDRIIIKGNGEVEFKFTGLKKGNRVKFTLKNKRGESKVYTVDVDN